MIFSIFNKYLKHYKYLLTKKMTTQLVIFINNEHIEKYPEDEIRYDLLECGDVEVRWTLPKNSVRYIEELKNDVNTHIFCKNKKNSPYMYIGEVKSRKVLQEKSKGTTFRMFFKMYSNEEQNGSLKFMEKVGEKPKCFEVLGLKVPEKSKTTVVKTEEL